MSKEIELQNKLRNARKLVNSALTKSKVFRGIPEMDEITTLLEQAMEVINDG